MNYLSVCSGIEAATVAWRSLGWKSLGFSEIERFPSEVLKYHYPETPNLGDMTNFKEWTLNGRVELLVGGTPCQSFSVAGLRKGLDDPRGNLALVYLSMATRFNPRWIVWENVPGVLSSNGGRDFGAFLGALGQLGYGFAYRVLDAQFFGVAQRRRRVFVVGHLGDWRPAAAVLFERESLSGHPAPSREKGEAIARGVEIGPAGGRFTDLNPTLDSRAKDGPIRNQLAGAMLTTGAPVGVLCATRMVAFGEYDGTASTVKMRDYKDATDLVVQPINIYGGNKRPDRPEGGLYVHMDAEISKTLDAVSGLNPTCSQGGTAVMQPITQFGSIAGSLTARHDSSPCADRGQNVVAQPSMQVRRLTPTECERLQGFPDGYTNIKKNCPDGPRYKALGNSMAVPVMRWIGIKIQKVEKILC